MKEEFEDTKGVVRIRKSRKNRQEKYNRINNDQKTLHGKLLIDRQ